MSIDLSVAPSLGSMGNPVAGRRGRLPNIIVAWFLASLIMLVVVAMSPETHHWFLFPVLACGVVIGTDAIAWVRGDLDAFSPVGVIGLLGVHFFFLAPMLQVHWDVAIRNGVRPDDWRPWLGQMAIYNLVGLLVYQGARRLRSGQQVDRAPREARPWTLNRPTFGFVLPLALAATGALQLLIFARFGGIGGYVDAFEAQDNAFVGFGWIFTISESFPILCMIGYAVYASRRPGARTWLAVVMVIVGFVVLKLLFGGLRGSRGNTIYGLIWAAGIVHLWIRPLTRTIIVSGVVVLFAFSYAYGFYKSFGTEGLQAITDSETRSTLERRGNRSYQNVLLGDFGRSDIQALVLYNFSFPSDERFELAYGRTYLGALMLPIPGSLFPGKPATKVKESTDVLYGRGSYEGGAVPSSHAYGIAGEAMLNFGPLGVPLAFAVLGLVVGRLQRMLSGLRRDDIRLLFIPFLVVFCLLMVIWDSDILVFYLIKNGAVPLAVLLLCARTRASLTSERISGDRVSAPSLRIAPLNAR